MSDMNKRINAPLIAATLQNQPLDLYQYVLVLKRYRFAILFFALLIAFIAAISLAKSPPIFKATATLLIEAQTAKAVSIEDVYGLNTTQKEYFLTQFEILKSKSLSEQVIQKLGLMNHKEFVVNPDKASFTTWLKTRLGLVKNELMSDELKANIKKQSVLNNFSSRLNVTPIKKTQLVNISFESKDPKLAALVANTIGEEYIKNYIIDKNDRTRKAGFWLFERITELEENLRESESKLQDFTQNNNLTVVDGVNALTGQRLKALQEQLVQEEKVLSEAQSIYDIVKKPSSNSLSVLEALNMVTSNRTIQDLKRDQSNVELKLSELSEVYGPKHPKIISAYAELASIEGRVANEIHKLSQNSGKLVTASKSRIEDINEKIASTRNVHLSNEQLDNGYRRLAREVSTNRKLYDTFLERAKETSITADFESAHAKFTDHATVPIQPSKPKKVMILALVFMSSLAIGAIVAFIFDANNDRFKTTEDVEYKLGQRLLGLIPQIDKKAKQPFSLYSFYDSHHHCFSEALRTLRTNFSLTYIDKVAKVVSVTSAQPNEGKTTTAINLSFAMAHMEKVLLIDADMRRPSIDKNFDLPPYTHGLSNILAQTDGFTECVYTDNKSGIDILTAGTMLPNPLEALSSDRFAELINQLTSQYDRIIIDTPPSLAVSDALVISQVSNLTFYVIGADKTARKLAQQGLDKLLSVNANIAGVVLNKVDMSKKDNYQGYQGYYDQYGYA